MLLIIVIIVITSLCLFVYFSAHLFIIIGIIRSIHIVIRLIIITNTNNNRDAIITYVILYLYCVAMNSGCP